MADLQPALRRPPLDMEDAESILGQANADVGTTLAFLHENREDTTHTCDKYVRKKTEKMDPGLQKNEKKTAVAI